MALSIARTLTSSAAAVVALASFTAIAPQATTTGDDETTTGDYRVRASEARLIREVSGPAVEDVQGVPARPVHAFNWDGPSFAADGHMKIDVDPVENTGTIKAAWTDRNGRWRLTQTVFAPPDHPSGMRLGPSAETTTLVEGDPIPTNVYLHGDTTAGGPILPTLFNHLATWGPADVTLNGEPFVNPYDGPAPAWITHTMTTIGTRLPNGTVTANNGAEFYNPQLSGNGDTQPDDMEVHLVFHDAPGPDPVDGNFPPPFSFFYHVMFEEVDITIGR